MSCFGRTRRICEYGGHSHEENQPRRGRLGFWPGSARRWRSRTLRHLKSASASSAPTRRMRRRSPSYSMTGAIPNHVAGRARGGRLQRRQSGRGREPHADRPSSPPSSRTSGGSSSSTSIEELSAKVDAVLLRKRGRTAASQSGASRLQGEEARVYRQAA